MTHTNHVNSDFHRMQYIIRKIYCLLLYIIIVIHFLLLYIIQMMYLVLLYIIRMIHSSASATTFPDRQLCSAAGRVVIVNTAVFVVVVVVVIVVVGIGVAIVEDLQKIRSR